MGVDIHVHICKYNPEDNFYHELSLYRLRGEDEKYDYYDEGGNPIPAEDRYKRISPYNGHNSEMFDGMRNGNKENGYGYFPAYSIPLNSLEPKLREEIKKKIETFGFYDFCEVSFSDFKNYLIEHPTVVDYDSDEWDTWESTKPQPKKENPLKYLFECCLTYTNFAERFGMSEPYSRYKILFWFDS